MDIKSIHSINNHLTVVLGSTNLLEIKNDDQLTRTCCARIKDAVTAITGIIQPDVTGGDVKASERET